MLNTTKKQINYNLRRVLVLGLAIIASIFGITLAAPASFRTTDKEASALILELENKEQKEVLGVNLQSENNQDTGCNDKKPIVGWIDFTGKKVIKQNLPEGQRASSCFESVEVAKLNGFMPE